MKMLIIMGVLLAGMLTGRGGAGEYSSDWKAFEQEVDAKYPFFELKKIGSDWKKAKRKLKDKADQARNDEEFLKVVMEALDVLRDGHAGFQKTRSPIPAREPEYVLPLTLMPSINKQVVIADASPEVLKNLHPGTLVRSIDGVPARKFLDIKTEETWKQGGGFSSPQRAAVFVYRQPLASQKISEHKLVVSDGKRDRTITLKNDWEAKGWNHTYHMPRLNRGEGFCSYTRLPSGVGYMYLRRIRGKETLQGVRAALSKFPDAKGWIIDLRGNGGGNYSSELPAALVETKLPLAVIIDAGCMSAGETLARDLKNVAGAKLFGSTTAGASSAKYTWSFPSGVATLILSQRSRGGLNGKPIEFFGIAPDVPIEADPAELARGENSEIKAAENFVLKK